MKILIAEDEPISRRILETTLRKWNYEVLVTTNGAAAWESLQQPDAPPLAILDWMMPELDGVDLCKRLRATPRSQALYLILLTAKGTKTDVISGLEGGADDYITKPFDPEELRARLRVGQRILHLQQALTERVRELEVALTNVRQLQGMLPMCAWCKKIRDDQNYWQTVESYLSCHTQAQLTHGICPDCMSEKVRQLEELRKS